MYICPICGIASNLIADWVVNPSSTPVEHRFSFCGHKAKGTLQISTAEIIPCPLKEKKHDRHT